MGDYTPPADASTLEVPSVEISVDAAEHDHANAEQPVVDLPDVAVDVDLDDDGTDTAGAGCA